MEERLAGGVDSEQAEDLQELKKWPVGERIGQGAFGDAFLITDPRTKKKYVLKRIRMARQNEWQRAATRQEIKLGAMLQHPYIVRFVNSWIRDGHEVNLVYDYCSQGDLQTVIRKQKARHTDELQLRRWLAELLLALHYLQSKQVLHRDLKSSNIFLTADNDVQIGDFGLATIRDIQDSSNHDQSIVGTPHFMSPEVLNRKKYDFKTDIWSLGCVIYELSALRSPFNAFNLNGLVSKICKSAVAPLPSQYSEDWNTVVKWMLKKNVSKRPSVEDLLASDALRSDVLWARERAAQLNPKVSLPPLPTPAPLLRQLSTLSGCGMNHEDDVLCAADDGTHTPQALSPCESFPVPHKDRGHGQIHCIDEAIYQPGDVAKVEQHHSHKGMAASGRQGAPGGAGLKPVGSGKAASAAAAGKEAPVPSQKAPAPAVDLQPQRAAANQESVVAMAATAGPDAAYRAAEADAADKPNGCQPEAGAAPGGSGKGVKPSAAVVKRVRRVSASVTTMAAPLTAKGPLATGATAAAAPVHKGAAAVDTTAAACITVPRASSAAATATMEADADATTQAKGYRPLSATAGTHPCEAVDDGRHLRAAGRARAGVRPPAQGKVAAGQLDRPQLGAPQGGSEGGCPADAVNSRSGASQGVESSSPGMNNERVDAGARPFGKKPSQTHAVMAPAPTSGVGPAQPGPHMARARLTVQRHTVASQVRAASAERRATALHGATASVVPKYRDAAKAVAAAAGAAAEAAQQDPAASGLQRSAVAEAEAAACGAANSGVAKAGAVPAGSGVAPAATSNVAEPSQRPWATAGVRAVRRPDSGRASPVRRVTRGNSGGGTRAAAGAGGPRATMSARTRPASAASTDSNRAGSHGKAPATVAATAAAPSNLAANDAREAVGAAGESPATCSNSQVSANVQAVAPDINSAAASVLQQSRQPQPRRNSYVSVSGQTLCEEFSLLSLPPPDEVVARSNSCSSLLPGRPAASSRSCHSQSPTSADAALLPLSPVSPARQVAHPAGRSRLQASAVPDASVDSSAEASSRQRSISVAGATPTVSGLSPAAAMPSAAFVAATQQPQLFDNQLWNSSPNLRKADRHGGGRGGTKAVDSPSRCSMSCEATGTANDMTGEVASSLAAVPVEAWPASDALDCPISFGDLAGAGVVRRTTGSMGGLSGASTRRNTGTQAEVPAGGVTVLPPPSGGKLSFGGFKPLSGTCSQPTRNDTSTPAFPPRATAPVPEQPSSNASLMSVSFASSNLQSVTRRLEMSSADQGSTGEPPSAPCSLGKWMTAREEVQSSVRAQTATPGTCATLRSQAVASPLLSPTGPSHRSQQRLTAESAVGDLEGARELEAMRDRLATFERVVALASRLHAMGRWHELGSVLSSMQHREPGLEGVAAGADGSGAVGAGTLPSSSMIPCVTSPNGGTRALNVGDKVIVGSRRGIATIRYWGPCHWAAGDYVGLELDRPEGKHQGEVDGVCYFRCLPLHGIFVKSSMLKPPPLK